MNNVVNPIGLCGIEFVEFASNEREKLHELFIHFGLSKLMASKEKDISYYRQNQIHFLINHKLSGPSAQFRAMHGPSISAMGWKVKSVSIAYKVALERGAKAAPAELKIDGENVPAIYGIGDSLLYFVEESYGEQFYEKIGLVRLSKDEEVIVPDLGFTAIDHLTNNVEKGTMELWANFYKNIFGFKEVRYFDIKGAKTGLVSYALRSPCGTFCIPINEGTDKKSQINEYLEEYKGPGIQHLAFLTNDIVKSLEGLASKVATLDIDDDYYATVFDRVPNVTEDRALLKKHNILIDGDSEGYLLQIFTKNVVGPIFIEIIQRKNHFSFGEGNFGALFRSIEKDQQKRGYLD